MTEKACKTCRRLVKGNLCPMCKSSAVTTNWKGVIVIFDATSDIAKEAGVTSPGKYAVRVK
jgi:DNA-directed RNA polymerase subunit E"